MRAPLEPQRPSKFFIICQLPAVCPFPQHKNQTLLWLPNEPQWLVGFVVSSLPLRPASIVAMRTLWQSNMRLSRPKWGNISLLALLTARRNAKPSEKSCQRWSNDAHSFSFLLWTGCISGLWTSEAYTTFYNIRASEKGLVLLHLQKRRQMDALLWYRLNWVC